HVCIRENPRVKIDDFIGVVQDGFDRHGISTELVRDGSDLPARCEYSLTYAAVRAWDVAEYMQYAHLRLEHNGASVGYAEYRLINRGGLDLRKFRDVKAKMDPVIDELLRTTTARAGSQRPTTDISRADSVTERPSVTSAATVSD